MNSILQMVFLILRKILLLLKIQKFIYTKICLKKLKIQIINISKIMTQEFLVFVQKVTQKKLPLKKLNLQVVKLMRIVQLGV